MAAELVGVWEGQPALATSRREVSAGFPCLLHSVAEAEAASATDWDDGGRSGRQLKLACEWRWKKPFWQILNRLRKKSPCWPMAYAWRKKLSASGSATGKTVIFDANFSVCCILNCFSDDRRQKEKRINPPSNGMTSPSPSAGGNGGGRDGNNSSGGNGNVTPTIPVTPPNTAAMLASIASITPPSSLTGLGSSPLSPDPPTPPNVPLSLVTTAHSYPRGGSPPSTMSSHQLAMNMGMNMAMGMRSSPTSSSSPLPLSLTYNPRLGLGSTGPATIPTE